MSSSAIITTDESQVRESIQNWAKAVRSRNIEAILKQHAPEILLFDVPPPVQSKGIDAYRQSWDVFYRWFGDAGTFELSELNVTAGDDVAFCTSLIRCTGSANGKSEELSVRLTVCYRKIDDQWMVVHEHHSEPSND
jgi:ketosteroid isomerase-like protein